MKYTFTLFILLSFCFGCNNNEYPKAENALDAGREFIDACLKGDFKRANAYMLQDSINNRLLQQAEKDWRTKSNEYHTQYQTASINIQSIDALTDSITIINYKNSFDKVGRKVKIISSQATWMVDFKYTFDGNL